MASLCTVSVTASVPGSLAAYTFWTRHRNHSETLGWTVPPQARLEMHKCYLLRQRTCIKIDPPSSKLTWIFSGAVRPPFPPNTMLTGVATESAGVGCTSATTSATVEVGCSIPRRNCVLKGPLHLTRLYDDCRKQEVKDPNPGRN